MKPERPRQSMIASPLTTVAVILGAALPALVACLLIVVFAPSGSKPKSTPPAETVIVPLNRVISTLTQHAYQGKVRLIITGSGLVEGTAYSDAFYRYTDAQGQPLDPPQAASFPLKIDGQPAGEALDLAETPLGYQSDHVYSMIYDAGSESHPISFGLSDPDARDNTGQFTIDVVQLD